MCTRGLHPSLCLDQSSAAPAGTVASKFLESDKNRLAQNVVSRADVQEAAIDLEKSRINHHFSTSLKEINGVEGLATSQKASGRCWLFAMLNTLRYPIIQQLDLAPDFELSQSHLFYWDKVERANFFLETIIETADEPSLRPPRAVAAQPAGLGRRAVGHVRQPHPEARRHAAGVLPGDLLLLRLRPHELHPHQQ